MCQCAIPQTCGIEKILDKDLLDANDDTERRCATLKQVHYSTLHNKFLFRVHRLTWHEGKIPDTQICVKHGGDKGGGSFKMSFQLCNVEHPNSPTNTCVFCVFEAADNITNLKIALEQFRGQIDNLETDMEVYPKVKPTIT